MASQINGCSFSMAGQLVGPTSCTYQGFDAFTVFLLCRVVFMQVYSIKWLKECLKRQEEAFGEVACGRSWGRSVWQKVTTGVEYCLRRVGNQLQ